MSRADEITQEYLAKKGAETVFLVTVSPLDYEAAEAAMKDLSGRLGGFFCGDTADFTPVLPQEIAGASDFMQFDSDCVVKDLFSPESVNTKRTAAGAAETGGYILIWKKELQEQQDYWD